MSLKRDAKKIFCILGMISGIAAAGIGLYMAFGFSGDFSGNFTKMAEFGADFYTYQYDATRNAAENTRILGNFLESAARFAFLTGGLITAAAGIAVFCFFGYKYTEPEKSADGYVQAEENPDGLPLL